MATTGTTSSSSSSNNSPINHVSIEKVATIVYYSILDSSNDQYFMGTAKQFPFDDGVMRNHCTTMTFILHNVLQFLVNKNCCLTDGNGAVCRGMSILVAHDGEPSEHVWNSFEFDGAGDFSIDLSLRQYKKEEVSEYASSCKPWTLQPHMIDGKQSFPLLSANGTDIKHPDEHGLLLRPIYAPIVAGDDAFIAFYKNIISAKLKGSAFSFFNTTTQQEDTIPQNIIELFAEFMTKAMKRIRDVLKI